MRPYSFKKFSKRISRLLNILEAIAARLCFFVFLGSFWFRSAFDRRLVVETVCLRRFHYSFFIELFFQRSQCFIDRLSCSNFNAWHGHFILSCYKKPQHIISSASSQKFNLKTKILHFVLRGLILRDGEIFLQLERGVEIEEFDIFRWNGLFFREEAA